MHDFGLKLWSTNVEYIPSAIELFRKGVYHYIELFDVPDTKQKCIERWKEVGDSEGISYVIHAPYSMVGFDLSHRNLLENNIRMADVTFKMADQLQAKYVIFHLGINGVEEEILFQLGKIYDPRMLIENKSFYSINGTGEICNGYSPDCIKRIMRKSNTGFCFDIGHAIYAANALKVDRVQYINSFLGLKPRVFHLSDGDLDGKFDRHVHIGEGSFDIKSLLKKLPDDCMVTLETPKKYKDRLDDYVNDVYEVKRLISGFSESD